MKFFFNISIKLPFAKKISLKLYLTLCFVWVTTLSIFSLIEPELMQQLIGEIFHDDGSINNFSGAFIRLAIAPFCICLFFIIPFVIRKRVITVNFLSMYVIFFLSHLIIYTHIDIFFDNHLAEDGILESATVVLSLLSCLLFFISGTRGCKFAFLLSAAWLIFAMEEISWGQRLFDLSSPQVFIQYNFQQETNLHNFLNPYFGFIYLIFNFLLLSFFTWFSELKVFSKFYNLPSVSMIVRVSDKYSVWIIPLAFIPMGLALGNEIIEQEYGLLGVLLSTLLLLDPNRKSSNPV